MGESPTHGRALGQRDLETGVGTDADAEEEVEMTINRITDIKPQRKNANRHTPRGMSTLERSVQADGWIGAITVAADGETFDGSARVEVGVTGFDGVEPIVVRSSGDRPIIHIREDIPSADDPRAVRLGLAANRVAELNLDFDPAVLLDVSTTEDLSGLWTRDELEEIQLDALREADIDAGLAATTSPQRKLGDTTKQIKPVLYADEIEVFESALAATGLVNRGQALIAIYQVYLDGRSEAR